MAENKSKTLKYLSLITLTLQNAVLGLSMRYSRTRSGDLFLSSTAVLISEVVKLLTCLVIVFFEEGHSAKKFVNALHTTVIKNYMDTLKICVPSVLYVIQNNLLYLSASHLDAATYQVSYQLKILTTAIFAVIILRKKLLPTQWISLVILVSGIACVQMAKQSGTASANSQEQNRLIGFAAVLGACTLSGFAGIYFEKMLKGADISVWMRNVQLSLLSLPFATVTCLSTDYYAIQNKGFFVGYDWFVCYLIVLQACGGLLVALVVKYADNILKGFATSIAIILTCIVSMVLFDFILTVKFAIGASLVIISIFLYGYIPKPDAVTKTSSTPNVDTINDEAEKHEFIPKV